MIVKFKKKQNHYSKHKCIIERKKWIGGQVDNKSNNDQWMKDFVKM